MGRRPEDHPQMPPPAIGVLLVNLGTPAAPDTASVRRYLKQFLSDPRVVELPAPLWQPVLRGVILNTRPRRSAQAYRKIWREEGSPLAIITARQAEALAARLGDGVKLRWAMRYGEPTIAAELEALVEAGCTRILLAPLYPQYCAATTASVHDAAFEALRAMRWQPALRILPPYYDDPAYIAALKTSLEKGLAGLDFEPQALIASFHGMPERTLHLGDPYHCHCQKTARLLSEALGRELVIAFQSRFGPAKWLGPATEAVLAAMPGEGVKRVAVFAPGFAADCLETLEEVEIGGKERFLDSGGEDFAYLPCLNDGAEGMEMLDALIGRELSGWL